MNLLPFLDIFEQVQVKKNNEQGDSQIEFCPVCGIPRSPNH